MRGEGWECDNCGAKKIVPSNRGQYSYDSFSNYPNGWLLLVGPLKGNETYNNTDHHFCSWKCVEEHATLKRLHSE